MPSLGSFITLSKYTQCFNFAEIKDDKKVESENLKLENPY